MPLRLLIVIMFLAATFQGPNASVGASSSEDGPAHPHQGKVAPFLPGDPNVSLDEEALSILNSGQPYQTQIQSGSSGRGLVVQDIHATADVVWGRIMDYENYSTMVPKTIESENYRIVDHTGDANDDENDIISDTDNQGGRKTIFTRMKVGFPMIKLQFFVKHEYYPELNSLTWTLDYTRKSDFDDSCGYWYVIPHPEKPEGWTRVYYSVDVSMYDWVPRFVVNFMSKQALTEATGWVKKHSELECAKLPKCRPDATVNGDARGNPIETAPNKISSSRKNTEQKASSPSERKRRRWFGKQETDKDSSAKKLDEDSQSMASGGTCSPSSSFSDSENEDSDEDSNSDDETKLHTRTFGKMDLLNNFDRTVHMMDTSTLAKIAPSTGLARYMLVASVCVLAMYNVHLYLSQQ